MGQILVSLCLPTVVYVAMVVLFVLLFRSGRTSMRHPEAVRVANWLHIPESIRALLERTNTPRFVLALVLITLAYACGISGAVQRAMGELRRVPRHPPIESVTSPLDDEVIADLCSKLEIPARTSPCSSKGPIFAEDFAPAVRDIRTLGVRTYDDVQQRLGRYQSYCEPPVRMSDGNVSFRCFYDFRGDGVYRPGFAFQEDGTLLFVYASPYDS